MNSNVVRVFGENGEIDNRLKIAIYSETGNWARHFSCVRLMVGMMTIFGSATMAACGVLNKQPSLCLIGALLWFVGLGVFVYFTVLVRKLQNRQRKMKYALTMTAMPRTSDVPCDDVPLIAMLVLSVVFLIAIGRSLF